MRRLDFLLTGFLAVLLTSCGQRVQNTDSKPAVKIDTVLSADRQIALQFPGRVKAAQDISLSFRVRAITGRIRSDRLSDSAGCGRSRISKCESGGGTGDGTL